MRERWLHFVLIMVLTVVAGVIALPPSLPWQFNFQGKQYAGELRGLPLPFKQGLDIQGGMQVVLQADLTAIEESRRLEAMEAARQVILRRVDLYGVNEPVVQTAQVGSEHRLIVELAGVTDSAQALALVGTTAQLDFRLPSAQADPLATESAMVYLNQFTSTGLTGQQLKRAQLDFDPTSGEPIIALEFTGEGRDLFAKITQENTGKPLAIFLDESPLMMPVIQTPIVDGRASITGQFTTEQARNLAIQLQAGSLPVPIQVLEQRSIGPSLGRESVVASVRAGAIGLSLVVIFMILYYGAQGFIASLALVIYSLLTVAIYKLFGVTLTVPGIAGLLLSIGMAVDSNILIFERMKEERRLGKPFRQAMELGFGRAWDSIKDANVTTIVTALVLINPFHLSWLNSSGLVRGFGVTLLIGVLTSLFTGIVVTRTFMRLFLRETESK